MTNKLPQGWVKCEFEKICNLYTGNSINEKEKAEKYAGLSSGLNYIATKNISNEHIIDYENGIKIPFENENFRIAPANTTLLCIEGGSAGRKIGFTNEDVCFVNKLCAFVPYSNDIISKYIYYYLQSKKYANRFNLNKSGLIGGVSISKLKTINIELAPLNEQKRIVEKIEEEFGKIDEGVEKLKSAQEQIKQYRQSVLKSAFDGKLYKTTEWIVSKLGDICDRALKRQDSKKETEIFKYIDISSIDNHKNIITGYVVCTGANAPSRARQIVKCGDVLFSTVRTYLKNVAFLDLNDTDLIASTGFCVIRGKENLLDGRFIFNMCLYDRFLEPLNKLQRGSSYPAVRDNDVFNQFINLPTIDEQKQIVKEIEKRFEVADEAERVIAENLDKAEQLKQSILKKAFEGRLVPQDPTDQPASELLTQIQAERGK